MDPLLNPYRPGAGVPPPILSGRESELEAISIMIGRLALGRGDRSIVLTGIRGVGKTALLWAGEDMAQDRGWIVASGHGRPCTNWSTGGPFARRCRGYRR
jgi:hypothetical protein